MFPTITQRGFMLAAFLLTLWPALAVVSAAAPTDGGAGLSLMAGRAGPAGTAFWLLLGLLPVLILGVVLSSMGHLVAGPFTAAIVLAFAVGEGGGIDGYIRRVPSASSMNLLVIESLVLGVVVWAYLWACRQVRSELRPMLWPRLVSPPRVVERPGGWRGLSSDVAAGAITTVAGGGVTWAVAASADTAQAMVAAAVGLAVGGSLARSILPHARPVAILVAPLAVSVVAHAWAGWHLAGLNADGVLERWFAGDWPRLAQITPLVYASAGVAGAAMGIGLAEAGERVKRDVLASS